ncbi:TPA: hypothetical protein HA239_05965 [Candidatus Woesearchaeota archaeon]|nr:hypothetical protein [Candidatus Woesearchaeota archaeon]HIH41923.1 hypothetical protein [Candidatus Woesearchaeota archaeon]
MQMNQPAFDYSEKIIPELDKFSARVDEIAGDDKRLRVSVEMESLEWHTSMSKVKRELLIMATQLKEMHKKMESMKTEFIETVMDFRTKTDKENFEKLKRKLERFNFEEYMTKEEFRKLLGKSSPE